MGKLIVNSINKKTEFINNQVKDRLKMNEDTSYSRFLESAPVFVNYYNQDDVQTTADVALGMINENIGESGKKYNKIVNVPLFGLDKSSFNLDNDEIGISGGMTGEAIMIPDTINKPIPEDYFTLAYQDHKYLFKITSIELDTIKSNNYYKITYKYDRDDFDDLAKHIVGEYTCIYDNIGSTEKSILKNDLIDKLDKLESIYDDIRSSYMDLFFNQVCSTFTFSTTKTIRRKQNNKSKISYNYLSIWDCVDLVNERRKLQEKGEYPIHEPHDHHHHHDDHINPFYNDKYKYPHHPGHPCPKHHGHPLPPDYEYMDDYTIKNRVTNSTISSEIALDAIVNFKSDKLPPITTFKYGHICNDNASICQSINIDPCRFHKEDKRDDYEYESIPINYYDPYLIEFINENHLFEKEFDLNSFVFEHMLEVPRDFMKRYKSSIFYNFDKKKVFSNRVRDLKIQDVLSCFYATGDNYYTVELMTNGDAELLYDRQYLDFNYKYEGFNEVYNVMNMFANKENDVDIMNHIIDIFEDGFYCENRMDHFICIPIILFIIKSICKNITIKKI